jgi:2-polyprenyl-3-methyl-5-hydroxy-6-metoxy-1,4-benzoquinol methylase
VADAIGLTDSGRSVLDLGGGHGWFAAALCKRNPYLQATVLDSEPLALIGREIMWEAGMDHQVTHVIGNPMQAELGGPHDVILCHPMLLEGNGPQVTRLLRRIRGALSPKAALVIVNMQHVERPIAGPLPLETAALELLHCVRTAGQPPALADLPDQLAAAGFARPRIRLFASTPGVSLQVTHAL